MVLEAGSQMWAHEALTTVHIHNALRFFLQPSIMRHTQTINFPPPVTGIACGVGSLCLCSFHGMYTEDLLKLVFALNAW